MNIGDKAPEILGKDEQGRDIRLSDYKGRKLVLYFYPKDNTSADCRHQSRVVGSHGRLGREEYVWQEDHGYHPHHFYHQ